MKKTLDVYLRDKLVGKYKFTDVTDRHWMKLAGTIGVRPDFMERQMHILANDIAKASTQLFGRLMVDAKLANPVYEKIIAVIALNHRRLLDPIAE